MKKISIALGCVFSLLTISCDKFLSLTPRDTKVVSTIEDYRDIMASFMYVLKTPNTAFQVSVFGVGLEAVPFHETVDLNLAVYTGETNINNTSSLYWNRTAADYTQTGKKMLTWMMFNTEAWSRYYAFLGPINLIISDIDTAEGNNEDLRHYVKGEALVWRAYALYKLLQYYAPYTNGDYGIPIYLTPQLDAGTTMPPRETQQRVFRQIFSDCDESLALLEQTRTNEWNVAWRADFIHAMLASVYTWKAMSGAAEETDWAQAETHASAALKGRTLSRTSEELKRIFDCSDEAYAGEVISDEFYVRIMDGRYTYISNFFTAYQEGDDNASDGKVTAAYASLFREGDIRREAWLANDGTYNNKYNLLGSNGRVCNGCRMPFRLAEMYLIKAEALCRQGRASEAASVLAEFCAFRYAAAPQIPADPENLLQMILDERTREFYQEGDFRWLDMKRLGVRVERVVNNERHVLEPDDFRYTFPIPAREMEHNKNMQQNPGWENIIIY